MSTPLSLLPQWQHSIGLWGFGCPIGFGLRSVLVTIVRVFTDVARVGSSDVKLTATGRSGITSVGADRAT